MAKLLMLFVDGVEDTEAIATLDVITRGGDIVVPVSLMKRNEINPKYLEKIFLSKTIEEVDYKEFDGLVIPGGPGSFKVMPFNPITNELIHYFASSHKLVAAICAAPHLVGKLGYLKGKNFTVHPGFEDQVIGGNYLREQGVVRDGDFITSKSMYYSQEFGIAIHAYYHGEESAFKLRRACQGE